MAGVQGSIYPGTYLISTPITIALTSNPAISSPATDFGFSIAGSGVTSCIFVIASTFSGGSYAFQLKGTGAFAGWRIGGFLIQPSASGSGSATVGWQIGDPSVAAIKIYGYQYSTIYDVAIGFFPTAWQVTNARMIRFVDCSGWNEGFSSQNTCLSITQYQSFTGDLLFEGCEFVTTNANANTCVTIVSAQGTACSRRAGRVRGVTGKHAACLHSVKR
jgi:hypothetical protein